MDAKLNSLNKAGNPLRQPGCPCNKKFSKSFVGEESANISVGIATKEILIFPAPDHQQEIVSLSEKKERNKQLSLLISQLTDMSRTETKYSNLKLGNVNG